MSNRPLFRVLGVAIALSVLITALPAAALAAPTPPVADRRLVGTWVNTNADTRSIKQIVVQDVRGGGMKVTAYGACGGGLCDWGTVPATVYGPNVSATSGAHFQTNQRFLSGDAEFARTALLGRVRSTAGGPRLVVRKLTVFTDGSGRRSFTTVERFAPGKAHVPTTTGHPVSDYPHGLPPAAVAGMFGSWKNASPTGNIVSISVNGSPGAPLVRAWGACSPTPCDMGTARGVTYGSSISSTRGKTMLASYTPGFKNHQLVLRYRRLAGGHEVLTATSYNEFVDGSGRSNYVRTETFVRS